MSPRAPQIDYHGPESYGDCKNESELLAFIARMGHKMSPQGVLQDPGKFEGEHFLVLYFYDLMMQGGEDEIIDGELEGELPVSVFILDGGQHKDFSSIDPREKVLALWEDEQGFCRTRWFKVGDKLPWSGARVE
jgi:hypothetical protein